MDESHVYRDAAEQDADAPLARDRFALDLGEEWQPEEPGIYRFVGADAEGDAFELHASQKPAVERRP
jgi:hypothetical protein